MKCKSAHACCDMKDHGYLGHFKQEKYLNQGHNDSGQISLIGDKDTIKQDLKMPLQEEARQELLKQMLQEEAKKIVASRDRRDARKFSE
jgi:hypothetical protein